MKKVIVFLLVALLTFILVFAASAATEAPDVKAETGAVSLPQVSEESSTGEEEALPVWQAVLEDILAYVVLGITAIIGIYTAFSPLLILIKKAANKFTKATAGVLSTATEGRAQNAEVKNLKTEIEKYIKEAADRQAVSEKEFAARAAQAEKMLGAVMQMLTTVCCASPELVKSGVARTVADLKNRFTPPVPALKDARKESDDHGKEA